MTLSKRLERLESTRGLPPIHWVDPEPGETWEQARARVVAEKGITATDEALFISWQMPNTESREET